MHSLIINSESDFKKFLDELEVIANSQDIDIKVGENIPRTLKIVIEGGDFDGTITPSVMEGIIDLQKMIFNLYKLKYGYISAEKKKELEFQVSVKKGSGVVDILYEKSIDALTSSQLAQGVIQNMTGGQIIIAIAIGGLVWLGSRTITNHYQYKKRELEKNENLAQQETIQKSIEALKEVVQAHNKATTKFSNSDFEKMHLQNKAFTSNELKEYGKPIKDEFEDFQSIKEGNFFITNIDMKDIENTYIDIKDPETEEYLKKVNIQKNRLEEYDYEIIKEAVDRHELYMQIIVTEKNNKITEVRLANVKKLKAMGDTHL